MKITSKALNKLKNAIDLENDCEMGGILGEINGVINDVFVDSRKAINTHYEYVPDVCLLNSVISNWEQNEGYQFAGLFHTHFVDGKISDQDKIYIFNIMACMPPTIKQLYFPIIVLPDFEINIYKAVKTENSILIQTDKIERYNN